MRIIKNAKKFNSLQIHKGSNDDSDFENKNVWIKKEIWNDFLYAIPIISFLFFELDLRKRILIWNVIFTRFWS